MVQNKTLETILMRKSIRKFKPIEVSRDKIEKIVKAGQRSPTACGVEAYSFILLTDLEKREMIIQETVSHITTRKFMEEAPVWIIICTYPNETPSNKPRWPLEVILHENEYIMPDKDSILERVSMRKNWGMSFPYKLSLEAEQKIRKEWNELGFLI
ncbi:MAG: nitroreductase family protein [Candidatus Bathyarchaeota archaeon]|nr:nitroreductase family protein [Candidatus Bathyarchaeota archaeon]